MASVDRERDERQDLDLNRFNSIIEEYSSSFKNPPKNARQLVQYCKDKEYNYKYGELNPFFSIWSKQQSSSTTRGGGVTVGNDRSEQSQEEEEEEAEINWESFWSEYEEKYAYPPKKAIHLWNFAKEEKFVTVKYKEARIAFDRIFASKTISSPSPIEGRSRSNTDLGLKSSSSLCSTSSLRNIKESPTKSGDNNNVKIDLVLKVTKYTSDSDLSFIKSKFIELLDAFRKSILHDPASPLQLFNFINEDTEYRVRYGDVKKCYNYAVKHKWFVPMKRMKKVNKKKRKQNKREEEGLHSDHDNDKQEEGVEFVLEVDIEKIEKEKRREEEEKKEIVYLEIMSDDEFDQVLIKYNNQYQNPPRNASQIMNFAKEIQQFYKYKACRIAFNRWKNCRGAVMPEIVTVDEEVEDEPGTVGQSEEAQDENENESEEEEEESD